MDLFHTHEGNDLSHPPSLFLCYFWLLWTAICFPHLLVEWRCRASALQRADNECFLLMFLVALAGNTLKFLLHYLSARKPASLEVCTLLRKKERMKSDIKVVSKQPQAYIYIYSKFYIRKDLYVCAVLLLVLFVRLCPTQCSSSLNSHG